MGGPNPLIKGTGGVQGRGGCWVPVSAHSVVPEGGTNITLCLELVLLEMKLPVGSPSA